MVFLALVILPLAVHGDSGSSKNSLQEVLASKILAKILNGEPVEYDHVIVRGDLDLSQWRLQANVTSLIRINDSIFDSFVNFSHTIFDNPIDMSGSNFNKDVNFSRATFIKDAKFNNATFSGTAGFFGTTFSEKADFEDADFKGAIFAEATFDSVTNFGGAKFSAALFFDSWFDSAARFEGAEFGFTDFRNAVFWYASFEGAKFSMDANFREAKFGGVSFKGTEIRKYADFRNATFGDFLEASGFMRLTNRFADFSEAKFGGDAYFDGTEFSGFGRVMPVSDLFGQHIGTDFGGSAYFKDVTFSGNANFNYAKFSSNASFEGASFSKNANFEYTGFYIAYFRSATFSRYASFKGTKFWEDANFREAKFGGDAYFMSATLSRKADFIGASFRGCFFGWDEIKDALTYDQETYLGFINNFKEHDRFDDADDCFYQYRFKKMLSTSQAFDLFKDMFSFAIYGYGVRWINTIAFALFILFIFGLVFSRNVNWDLRDALSISAILLLSLPLDWRYSKREAYAKLIENHIYSATLERLIGWSLLIILISTISRIMVRY